MTPSISDLFAARLALMLSFLGLCVVAFGCSGQDTIWSGESPSPDGITVASAHTTATSGFGTGAIWTEVYLGDVKHEREPMEILMFDDEAEGPSDEISVNMEWLTPTHLEVTYKGHQTVYFQAIKYGDLEISVRDLSKVPSTLQQPLDDLGIRIAPKSR